MKDDIKTSIQLHDWLTAPGVTFKVDMFAPVVVEWQEGETQIVPLERKSR